MIKFTQKPTETTKEFLVRAAIIMLDEHAHIIDSIMLEDSECDAYDLAQKLREEFEI